LGETRSERWTGYFCPQIAGTFDFFVGSFACGSFRLLVDGKTVPDDWQRSKAIVDFVPLRLQAGAHKIVLEHRFRSEWHSRLNFGISRQGERVSAKAKALAAKADKVARPGRELKGFTKIELRPGETRRVSIEIDRRALAYFNAACKKWQVDPGSFTVMAGRSCEDILLRGTVKFTGGRLRF
jgi:hypothetical protein